jgi:thioredoxin reductase
MRDPGAMALGERKDVKKKNEKSVRKRRIIVACGSIGSTTTIPCHESTPALNKNHSNASYSTRILRLATLLPYLTQE